jgi:hypothetical protein
VVRTRVIGNGVQVMSCVGNAGARDTVVVAELRIAQLGSIHLHSVGDSLDRESIHSLSLRATKADAYTTCETKSTHLTSRVPKRYNSIKTKYMQQQMK